MRSLSYFFIAMIAVMAFTPLVHGDVILPNVIGDHMVLQQGIAVPVWGEAAAGEKNTAFQRSGVGSGG